MNTDGLAFRALGSVDSCIPCIGMFYINLFACLLLKAIELRIQLLSSFFIERSCMPLDSKDDLSALNGSSSLLSFSLSKFIIISMTHVRSFHSYSTLLFCLRIIIVFGFFKDSFTGIEQGPGHTIKVGWQKGAAQAGVNLVFNVISTGLTASRFMCLI